MSVDATALSSVLEDYLEVISRLISQKGKARVRDIASELSVHKSTATAALKSLEEKGMVNYRPYAAPTLTPEGRQAARGICRRHEVIREFLTGTLLLDPRTADDNACRMEHGLDDVVLDRLSLLAAFFTDCPQAGKHCVLRLRDQLERAGSPDGAKTLGRSEGGAGRPENNTHPREEEKTMTTLNHVSAGQEAKVVKVRTKGAVRRRIVDMGVVRGVPIRVVKVAPLGDPIEIKVKGYNLSLRKEEAEGIDVEVE